MHAFMKIINDRKLKYQKPSKIFEVTYKTFKRLPVETRVPVVVKQLPVWM